jgi:hypothetical protein
VQYPVRVDNVRLIETAATKLYKGSFLLDDLEVDVPSEIDAPAPDPLLADRLISPDGNLAAAWSFAALSDVQFTAASPELTKVAIAALERIRATHPDFVVLNGDIVDTGYPADIALAKATLEAGGCDLVKAGEQPNPAPGEVPCQYVPGNQSRRRSRPRASARSRRGSRRTTRRRRPRPSPRRRATRRSRSPGARSPTARSSSPSRS